MGRPKLPKHPRMKNAGRGAVQIGQASGNVTVVHLHYHGAPPAAAARPLLALQVYEPHQLPRGVHIHTRRGP